MMHDAEFLAQHSRGQTGGSFCGEEKVTERNGEEEERILVVGNKSELSGS